MLKGEKMFPLFKVSSNGCDVKGRTNASQEMHPLVAAANEVVLAGGPAFWNIESIHQHAYEI